MDKSLKDFDRFKKQKVRDINEIQENYVKTQIKVNKLVSTISFLKCYFSCFLYRLALRSAVAKLILLSVIIYLQ